MKNNNKNKKVSHDGRKREYHTLTMSYRNRIITYLTMSYSNGITAAIMELRNQTGSSASNIKKTMQENDFADRKWMNAMFFPL
jgi:hypothetical protein